MVIGQSKIGRKLSATKALGAQISSIATRCWRQTSASASLLNSGNLPPVKTPRRQLWFLARPCSAGSPSVLAVHLLDAGRFDAW